uniref:NAD(P)-binding protein n=1 Tax=Panagrellus redivivus TaxID=6233 RepID=A0A7E4VKG7_PANRE
MSAFLKTVKESIHIPEIHGYKPSPLAAAGAVAAGIAVATITTRYALSFLKVPNLDQKPVFITGCDSGFGKALVLKLLKNGIPVIAGCLTEAGAGTLTNDAAGLPGKLKTLIIDVTSEESVKAAAKTVEESLENGQKLWALVTNAGILIYEGVGEWVPIESYKKTFDVNTLGTVRAVNAFLPQLRESEGRIVAMVSSGGRIAIPTLSSYCTSKFALEGYMDILRREVKQFNISVHILTPGRFKTGLTKATQSYPKSAAAWQALPTETKAVYGEGYLSKIDNAYYEVLEKDAYDDISAVTDAYYHALTARYPKLRYACGFDCWGIFLPTTFFTTEWQDWFLGLFFQMPTTAYVANKKAKKH